MVDGGVDGVVDGMVDGVVDGVVDVGRGHGRGRVADVCGRRVCIRKKYAGMKNHT